MKCPNCGYIFHSFNFLKQKILKRDKYKCISCYRVFSRKIRSLLVIHHINENNLDNSEDNLITLCRKCHAKRHEQIIERPEIILLREKNMTFEEIGKIFGLSRQRIHQIYKKNNYL